MSQQEFDNLLQQYLSGTISPEGERKVLEWYKQLTAESRQELREEDQQHIEGKIWAGIQADIEQPAQPAPDPKGRVVRITAARFLRVGIAACLIALAGIGLYFLLAVSRSDPFRESLGVPDGYQAFLNEGKTDKAIRLADGSIVMLQTGATLYYPEAFSSKTRDVYLKGDAFFSIHHNPAQHFIVHAGKGLQTEVMGTSFHILQPEKAGKIEVSVVTGKVWVHPQNKNGSSGTVATGVVLTPNQKAVYLTATSELLASVVDEPRLLVTQEGKRFVFEDAPLNTVLEAMKVAYGINISVENKNLNKCHFTGDITRQGLYEKLRLICLSTGTSYQVEGTVIVLKGPGCP